jgi:hypothetical protein
MADVDNLLEKITNQMAVMVSRVVEIAECFYFL